METILKTKLTLSSLDNKLELTSKVFLVIMWGLTIYTFLKSPSIIPIHFNALGQADNYGNKVTDLVLPILATVIYFGLTQLIKYPHLLTKGTVNNSQKHYIIAARTLRFLKLIILFIFSLIILFTYLTTIRVTNGLGFWFFPLTIGLFLIPIIIPMSETFRKKDNRV